MPNYITIHNIWEITKVFAPVLITIGAMWFIDNQNKKRWLSEGYLKKKVEFEIKIRDKFYDVADDFLSIAKFISGCGLFEDIESFEKFSFEEIIKEKKQNIVDFYRYIDKNKSILQQYFSKGLISELFSFSRASAGISDSFYLKIPNMQIEKSQPDDKRVLWIHIRTQPNPLENTLRIYLSEVLDSKKVQMLSNEGLIQFIENKIDLIKKELDIKIGLIKENSIL